MVLRAFRADDEPDAQVGVTGRVRRWEGLAQGLYGSGMETCVAVAGHVVPDRSSIRVTPGDRVVAGERDTEWPEFVFVTAASGEGWVPARYLSNPSGEATVVVAYDTTELPTTRGEHLEVVERDRIGGWTWCRNDVGREGWVPDQTLDLA